jgi:hypothetical protein
MMKRTDSVPTAIARFAVRLVPRPREVMKAANSLPAGGERKCFLALLSRPGYKLPLCLICLLLAQHLKAANITVGQAVGWGVQVMPYVEPGTMFTNIAACGWHNLAIQTDGKVTAGGGQRF